MSIKHISIDEADEFYTDERCHILEIQNDSDIPNYSLARARVEPGVITAWHRLIGVEECYFILSGEGIVYVGEEYQESVKLGDFIHIPADCAQRIQNTGLSDLVFLCYCTPPFSDACYDSLE